MPVLAFLLPDFVLVAILTGLRFLESGDPVVHVALSTTSGAIVACLWSDIRFFLVEKIDERKFRAIGVGMAGAAVFALLYLAFGNGLLELHEWFFARRRAGLGPPLTETALTFMIVGMMGSAISLLVDHSCRSWRER
jgi:hypothetical protein